MNTTNDTNELSVIPAKAGIQSENVFLFNSRISIPTDWIPAFAGMTMRNTEFGISFVSFAFIRRLVSR